MRYTFRCLKCGYTEPVSVPLETRNDPRTCPECGAEVSFVRDVERTLAAAASSTPFHRDVISHVEERFGRIPGFTPPTSSVGREGRHRAGAQRILPGDPKLRRKWE